MRTLPLDRSNLNDFNKFLPDWEVSKINFGSFKLHPEQRLSEHLQTNKDADLAVLK